MRALPSLLLPILLVLAVPAVEASKGLGEFTVYALATEDGSEFTVFARHDHRFVPSLAVPLEYSDLDVTDAAGRSVQWARTDDGVIMAGERNTTLYVTARGVPGPAEQHDLRFGKAGMPITRFIVGLPSDHASDGMQRIDQAVLLGDANLSAWPFPADRTYWTGSDYPSAPQEASFAPTAQANGPTPYALLAVLLVLLGLTTVWLMVRVHRSTEDPTRPKQMPVLQHLEELRNRTLWVLGTLVGGAFFFFTFGFRWFTLAGYRVPLPIPSIYDNAAAQVFSWMVRSFVPAGVEVVVISPWDAVVTQLTLALALAVLVAFPVLFYHLYAYLAPALYPRERRAVFISVPVVVVLFALGAAFGLRFMLPFLIAVLYGFAGTLGATAFLNVPDLVALGALNAVVFGLAFELPVVMALLSAIGVVQAATWRRSWRHAIIVILIVAALVTDPTIITQLIVAGVLMVLYGIGILLAYVFERRAARAGDERPVGGQAR